MQVAHADKVLLDKQEHFRKMTYRNRYRISGANNSILLSVPLQDGRNQRIAMEEVKIFNGDRWQTQHWRTLVSVYRRTPFFDHYEDSLMRLFQEQFTSLATFNIATIEWVKKQLKLKLETETTTAFVKEYPEGITDLRNANSLPGPLPKYYQVFEDRIGFVPDLSILDLLFSEGPAAGKKLIGV